MFLISVYEDKTFPKRSLCQKCMSWIRQHLAKVQQEVSKHGSQWPQRQATWCRWKHYLEQKLLEGRIRYGSVKFGLCFTCKSETFHRNTAPFDVIFLYMVDIWYYFIHRGITPIAVQHFVKPKIFVQIRDALHVPASLCHTGLCWTRSIWPGSSSLLPRALRFFGFQSTQADRLQSADVKKWPVFCLTVVMVIDMKQTLSFFLFQSLPFSVCPNVLLSVPKWGGSKSGLMWRQSYALRKCTGTQRISKSSLEKLGTKRSQTFTRLVRFHPRGRLMKNGFHTWEKTQSKMCSLKSTRIEHSLNSCILFAWKSLLELHN